MIHRINTNRFFYHSPDKIFAQEASTLDSEFNSLFGRLFADNKTVGFELVSERTGNIVIMKLDRIEFDGDGDTREWVFRPLGCQAFEQLVIWND